jgi:hybrid cluster-associated redox disulfide protein
MPRGTGDEAGRVREVNESGIEGLSGGNFCCRLPSRPNRHRLCASTKPAGGSLSSVEHGGSPFKEGSEAMLDDMTVDEIMRRWPSTIRVFHDNGMYCVGCPIGSFHTLPEASEAHGLDPDRFEQEIARLVYSEDGSPSA